MGLEEKKGGNTIYLSVGFGAFRRKTLPGNVKVDGDTQGAVLRKTQQGKESWALEYPAINGRIENIFYKTSEDYNDTYEVVVDDGELRFQISFTVNGRMWTTLAKRLPNIQFEKPIRIAVWDYEVNGSRKVGLSVEQEGNPNAEPFAMTNGDVSYRVKSYYEEWKDKVCTLKNGLPSVNWDDKDEREIDLKKVTLFLKSEFKLKFEGKIDQIKSDITEAIANTQSQNEDDVDLPDNNPEDDLPF